jgi:uroporphyrinogen-III synthase
VVTPIIWTRSTLDAGDDAELLKQYPRVIRLPLLQFQSLEVQLPEENPQYLLVTSQKALARALQLPRIQQLRDRRLPVVTFGAQTAAAASEAGFRVLRLHAATGNAMAEQIYRHYPPARAWYLTSSEPATRLDEILNRHGWNVRALALYKTVAVPPADLLAKAQPLQAEAGVVCFASPSAARGFCQQVLPQLDQGGQNLVAVVIGSTTQAACKGAFADCVVAPEASLRVLFETAIEQARRMQGG